MWVSVIRFLYIAAMVLTGCFSFAQEIQRIGSPLVQSYTKAAYKAGNQNWAIAVGKDGIMYAANADGLLVFDGQYWTLHPLPNKSTVRSVAIGEDGKIYTGGLAEFGYWEEGKDGQLQYHAVSGLLDQHDTANDEIWKIIVDGERVIFQSFSTLYVYYKNEIEPIRVAGQPFLFAHAVNGRVFVELIPSGLHELTGNTLVPVQGKGVLSEANILSMLAYSADEILIGTAKSGLFVMNGAGEIMPWQNDINELLKNAQLNNGLKVLDKYYAFGTILNGVMIIDQQGRLVQHLNKANGLQNNTVLSIHSDRQENIWLGLDNGIDRLEINAPLYYYNDNTGSIGTVYAARIYKGYIYLGTNQGLFYSPWPADGSYRPFSFRLIENSQGQVWDLTIVDDELLCGHNDGTFKVQGDKLVKISPFTGGWTLRPLPDRPGKMIQGTYTGLVIFNREASGLQLSQRINGFRNPAQFIVPRSGNRIWTSGYQGLYSLTLDEDLNEVTHLQRYDDTFGLPNSAYFNVFDLAGKIVFATDSGFYQHDEITDRFYRYEQLNEHIGSFANSNKIISAGKDRYWFVNRARIALVHLSQGGEVKVDSAQFATLNERMMKFYESVNLVKEGMYLISLDNGFAIYQMLPDAVTDTKIPMPLIRSVKNITDSLSGGEHMALMSPEIPYKNNNIRINYASPWYSAIPLRYQFYLEGYSRTWSEWSEAAQKEFTNLRHGDYKFRVRTMAPDGAISGISEFQFTILPPWYLSWWAFILYTSLGLMVILMVRRRDQQKLHKHRLLVQQKMTEQQEALLKREAEESEKRLVRLKNEQLKRELASKSRELANAAMNIVYKNELLTNVHDELLELKDHEGRRLSVEQLRKINKIIDDARSDERDWNLFEDSFNEAHENFFKKLKADYPDLVPNDLKLCAYLRMNMNSKEIASLLNITTRGVEIRRYRLRKKLNLPHEKNLSEFLMEV